MKNAINAGKRRTRGAREEGAEGKGEKANATANAASAAANAARVTGGETKISRFLVLN